MNGDIAYTRSDSTEDLTESEGFRLDRVINTARLEKGLSLRELARKVGCSHVFLMKVESGEKTPSPKLLGALQNELGLEPFYRIPKSELVRIKQAEASAQSNANFAVLFAVMLNALEQQGLSKACNIGVSHEESEAGLIAGFKIDKFPDFEIMIRKSKY